MPVLATVRSSECQRELMHTYNRGNGRCSETSETSRSSARATGTPPMRQGGQNLQGLQHRECRISPLADRMQTCAMRKTWAHKFRIVPNHQTANAHAHSINLHTTARSWHIVESYTCRTEVAGSESSCTLYQQEELVNKPSTP
eukprot:371839-Amphidinium_carterae.1